MDQDEYFQALDAALDLLAARSPTSAKPMGEQVLSAVLAWAWDSSPSKPDTLAGLMCCDRIIGAGLIRQKRKGRAELDVVSDARIRAVIAAYQSIGSLISKR
jgi:hypothetical protein